MTASFGSFTADAGAAPTPAPEARGFLGEEVFFPPVDDTAGMVVNPWTAVKFPALLAVLNVLATDVAALPCRVYRRQEDGGRLIAADHPVDDLLNVSPDGETTAICWRQALMVHALLWGNGYAEIVRKGSRPASLHLIDPSSIVVVRNPATRALEYHLSNGQKLPSSKVFHLAGLGFDGVSGWSFVELIERAIGVGLAEEAFQGDFFRNGSDPGGVISLPKKFENREKKLQFIKDWNARFKGPGKRHGTAVLEEGGTYTATTIDPDKSQLLEARKYQVLEVARPWRAPPHKVGDYSQAHLANLESSNQDYLNTALMPWLVAFEQQAALKLFSPAERKAGVYAEHTVEALLRGDLLKRYQAYEVAIRNGWMNRDQVCRKENASPIGKSAGGDKYTVQLNLTTLDRVGAPDPVQPTPTEGPTDVDPPAA
ncbi:phage portal protein [Paludisphaera sp.]|uniref:phage portal protein n=1 Tax=Paludisphaera sp. TaxID=2017432 RepID=UPI00301D442F